MHVTCVHKQDLLLCHMGRTATMSPTALFFCLLLLPQLGTSNHFSYTLGSKQFFVKTSDKTQATSAPTSCSSIPSGVSNKDRLPVVHRLSPCSPLNGVGKNSNPSPTEVYRRDVRRVRSLFAGPAGDIVSSAPGDTTMPTNGVIVNTVPGTEDYAVVVSFGTPMQPWSIMVLETSLGLTLLRCEPCTTGASDCGPAPFNATESSTFSRVPCGSPDCRTNNCSGSVCPLPSRYPQGSVVQDVLTLAPYATPVAISNFTFGCVDNPGVGHLDGLLDLSRDSRSVASRLATPDAPAFSYCLPPSTSSSSNGFLTVGVSRPLGARVQHDAPMVVNPAFPNMYFIELVGIRLGVKDLPIPPATETANTTAIDVGTSFTFLKPAVYALLRDVFRAEMADYPTAPPRHGLDTCYNFTGLKGIAVPLVRLVFGNGESFLLHGDQMLYYEVPSAAPFTVACLAFAASPYGDQYSHFSVIGTLAQATTEVVYNVSGGKVGFVPDSC